MRKNIARFFKDIGFTIDIETSPKIVGVLDIMFNLNYSTYGLYKKPNDLTLCISKSSSHTQQIINQLSEKINELLSFLQ